MSNQLPHPVPGTGSVTLVGAGPGDPDLLTLKAVKALQSADVILFDHLVSDEILDLARREARRMLVGKRGYRPSCRQEDINAMMIKLARAGRRVVRLKAGDPMIFGRAGEEIEQLRQAGIAVDVVPGVTAAAAMASTLCTSLTHRNHAQCVQFVTGHGKDGGLSSDVDWSAVANNRSTVMFYMGGRLAQQIVAQLIANGLPADQPTVIGAAVSQPGQQFWAGPLQDMPDAVRQLGTERPLVIGVGAVFSEALSQGLPGEQLAEHCRAGAVAQSSG